MEVPVIIKLGIVVSTMCCSASAIAQPNHQRVLDTAVVANGVLPGYLTTTGEHVLRMQFGPALEMHRYAEDGTPLWGLQYTVEGTAWNTSAAIGDASVGGVVLGNAEVFDREGPDPRVAVFHMGVGADGAVLDAGRLELGIAPSIAVDLQPTTQLVRSSDGATFILIGSADPGHPLLLIVKRSATGGLLWARGLGDTLIGTTAAWGDPNTRVCSDSQGGLFALRRGPFATSTWIARVNAGGDLVWLRSFEDPSGYSIDAYDIAPSSSGELLVLGRMFATGLPSGGTLQRISPQGELLRYDRYPWDVGRRLFVEEDGGMATVKTPWIYRLDDTGQVLWSKYFEGWMIDPHQYIFEMTNMEVQQGRLWKQGVLRKILVQFNTQRLLPAFSTHPLDSIVGCQWDGDDGFSPTALDVSAFTSTEISDNSLMDLDGSMQLLPAKVLTSVPNMLSPSPLCDQVVGITDTPFADHGPRLNSNPVLIGTALELLDVEPGAVVLMDAHGRSLWSGRVDTRQERLSIAPHDPATGLYYLRWVAADGSRAKVLKVVVL